MRAAVIVLLIAVALLGLSLLWTPSGPQPNGPAAQLQAPPEVPQPADAAVPFAAAPSPQAQGQPEPEAVQPSDAERNPAVAPNNIVPNPSSPEYAALLAARFDADPPDVNTALEREIASKVATLSPAGSRLDAIECRQMLCRVRTLHADKQAYDEFMADAFQEVDMEQRLWRGQAWVAAPSEKSVGAGTRIESVIYLQRDPNPAPK